MRGATFAFILFIAVGLTYSLTKQSTENRLNEKWRQTTSQIMKAEQAKQRPSYISPENREDVLWLARVLYSETKRPYEMPTIAWIVRNRVETNYKGSTYREVALHNRQFSGLHSSDAHYERNIGMTFQDTTEVWAWNKAVRVAHWIVQAPDVMRPFPKTTRHYYSPHAIKAPDWAHGHKALHIVRKRGAKDGGLDEIRFAFYDKIN